MAQTRLRFILVSLIVAFGLSAISGHAAKPAKSAKPAAKPAPKSALVLSGTSLALPANCKVKVRWICPPLDAKAVDESHWYDTRFVVDSAGRPWFGADRSDVLNPTQQYRFTFSHLYKDIACLDNGTFLVSTDSDLGFVTPPEAPKTNYDGKPVALFQPIAGLPIPECKLFAGVGNCVYLVGWNSETEMNDVYVLRPEKLAIGGTGVREYVKVFSSKEDIAAVAGDGNVTYLAMERVAAKVSGSNCTKVYVSPDDWIRGLAYSPQAGLFVATYRGIQYVGASGVLQIMAGDDPKIYLQKGSLYVFFPKTMGVLALDNVQDLKRFNLAFKPIPATQSDEVKVTDVRFFEAGETAPDYGDRQYATKVNKASTRYVYCQVDMTNLLKGKRRHTQMVTMELCWPGETNGRTEDVRFDFTPDVPGLAGWARFGDANPGTLYPGAYTLKTFLNGSKIDERRFTVEGEPSVYEAAAFGDTAKLWKLVEAGGDVNALNAEGWTPLMAAVDNGSLENVRLLLQHGAKINEKNNAGETALLRACQPWSSNTAMIRVLLEAGADPNIGDKDGETPLHKITNSNKMEAARLLLDHKADPNARDKDQSTPLMSACQNLAYAQYGTKPEFVELLLNHGGDVKATDKNGESALSITMRARNPEVVRMLIKNGADVNAVRMYEGGSLYSILGDAIVSYSIESDRLSRSKLREIIAILCESGAKLLSNEGSYAVTSGTVNLLGRKQIAAMLDASEDAALKYQPEDPWLQRYVLKRLIQMAYIKISWAKSRDDFHASLNLCQEARTRAEKWKLDSLVPELYYNIGMLAVKVSGDREVARQNLQKYLELAPNGWKSDSAKSLLNGL